MPSEQVVQLLPAGTRLVHIGHPKSGSTAIQAALARERARLPEHGVVYPGRDLRSARAGWAVLGIGPPIGRTRPPMRRWESLCQEVTEAGDARVCISNEDFARATPDVAPRIVAGLGGERAHVVLVARRLDKLLPSHWQERVKALQVTDYDDYLRTLLSARSAGGTHGTPWVTDLPGLVARWTDVVGPERFTLIVGDESDHGRVPAAFERMLGLPEHLLDPDPANSNRGLSLNETEWVRELNRLYAKGDFSPELYHQLIQKGLVLGLTGTAREPSDLPLPVLPDWAVERVAELDDLRVAVADRFGINVLGDPEDLRSHPAQGSEPGEAATSLSVAAAARGVHGLLEAVMRREEQLVEEHSAIPVRGPDSTLLAEATGRELVQELRLRAARRLRRR